MRSNKIEQPFSRDDISKAIGRMASNSEARRKREDEDEANRKQAKKPLMQRLSYAYDVVSRESKSRAGHFGHRHTFQFDAGDDVKKSFEFLMQSKFNGCKEKYIRQPWYDDVIEWLKDNKSKWLLLCGNCGVGKTVVTFDIFKMIAIALDIKDIAFLNRDNFAMNYEKVYKKCTHYVIDDMGAEDPLPDGTLPSAKLIYASYDDGACLVMSTNLRMDQLKQVYGERIYDRLKGMCKIISIETESLRYKDGIDAVEYFEPADRKESGMFLRPTADDVTSDLGF